MRATKISWLYYSRLPCLGRSGYRIKSYPCSVYCRPRYRNKYQRWHWTPPPLRPLGVLLQLPLLQLSPPAAENRREVRFLHDRRCHQATPTFEPALPSGRRVGSLLPRRNHCFLSVRERHQIYSNPIFLSFTHIQNGESVLS